VISIQGDIEYRAPKSRSTLFLRAHHLLEKNGRLRLEDGESITLESLRGDTLSFHDDSYIKLSDFEQNGEDQQTIIDIYRGHGAFKVNRLSQNSNFKVRTSRFTTSVRGTEFSVQDDQVTVTEGEVVVQPLENMDTNISVTTGQTANINNDGEIQVQESILSESSQTNDSQNSSSQETQITNQISEQVSEQQEQSEAEQLVQIKVNINAHD
jgi:hypothetical protein